MMKHKFFSVIVILILTLPTLIGMLGLAPNRNTEKEWNLKFEKPDSSWKLWQWINFWDEQYAGNFPGRSLLFKNASETTYNLAYESILKHKARIGQDSFMFLGNSFRNSHLTVFQPPK